jgi:hypothetical protein
MTDADSIRQYLARLDAAIAAGDREAEIFAPTIRPTLLQALADADARSSEPGSAGHTLRLIKLRKRDRRA